MQTLEIKTGYLYLIRSLLLGGSKIGITTAPKSRFKALAVGTKAELIGYWSLGAYRELEKQLHTEYKAERIPQSEWFDLTGEQVANVIRAVTSIAQTEFLLPAYVQSFSGPQYKLTQVPPYLANEYAGWKYFGILVISIILTYLWTTLT